MFKETPEGQTHSFNDGCGEPEHNCDCKTKYYKHYESDFDRFVKSQGCLGEFIPKATCCMNGCGDINCPHCGVLKPPSTCPKNCKQMGLYTHIESDSKQDIQSWEEKFENEFMCKCYLCEEQEHVFETKAETMKSFIRQSMLKMLEDIKESMDRLPVRAEIINDDSTNQIGISLNELLSIIQIKINELRK